MEKKDNNNKKTYQLLASEVERAPTFSVDVSREMHLRQFRFYWLRRFGKAVRRQKAVKKNQHKNDNASEC